MDVLVALLPPAVLLAIGLGLWALLRRPRLVVPTAWIVTGLVTVVFILLPLVLPGRMSEANRLLTALPAVGFLAVMWLGVAFLRRRRSR